MTLHQTTLPQRNIRALIAILAIGMLGLSEEVALAWDPPPNEPVIWHSTAFTQGGYAIGRLRNEFSKAHRLRAGDQTSPITQDGTFAVGFAIDANDVTTIHVLESETSDQPIMAITVSLTQRTFPAQQINGLPQHTVIPPEEVLDQIRADSLAVKQARAKMIPSAPGWIVCDPLPPGAKITGIFGARRVLNTIVRSIHYGVDLAAPQGTPVASTLRGTVTLAQNLYLSGKTVIINHGAGLNTSYLHLSSLNVQNGQSVSAGDILGTVGSTGRSTGAHLDIRANWGKIRIDPNLLVLRRGTPCRKP